MVKEKLTIAILLVLCCAFVLPGCKDTEKDKAVAEADSVKAKLAEVLAVLNNTESEKENLQAQVAQISAELKKARSDTAAVLKLYEASRTQAVELDDERNAAVAEAKDAKAAVKKLTARLKEKTDRIREFEEWVAELQATVKYLEDRIEKTNKQSTEIFTEQVKRLLEGIREPDVVYIPTPQDVVDKMLELAKVKKDDLVYDLGCGDGRIVVTAAKKYGCRAIGYDIDPRRVRESRENVENNKVAHMVKIEQRDIFTLDLSRASVITLYLLPALNVELLPQLGKLKPGSRIVSHDFDIAGIRPDKVVTLTSEEDGVEHDIYLWTTPLNQEDI
ncbi:MAG: methyltransferase domain-containing protein [Planctomycetota bacterium]|jgi:predicted RNA methylase